MNPMHRSNRYFAFTKLQRAAQSNVEQRRSRISFAVNSNRLPMIPYVCEVCHLTFGTTWLDHCPCCGSRDITQYNNLPLAISN